MNIRNVFSSFHLGIQLLCAVLIVIFGYLVSREFHYRSDLSHEHVYSLSPQTIQVLQALRGEPIRVFSFFRENQPSRIELQNLLKEYAYHHDNFRYEFFDPDRMPSKVKEYQVDAYETVVIDAKGKRQKTRRISEEALTNLLAKLMLDETKTIVFATGYSGPVLTEEKEPQGYGRFRSALSDSHYEVRETVLLRDGIPKGVDLLVVAGPHIDLLPEELQILRTYLESDGNVLILIDPVDPGEGKNLEEFLLGYGIQLGHDVIVDKLSKLFGADYLIPLVSEYKPHPITNGFRTSSFFPIARSVRKSEYAPSDTQITEIVWTSAAGWAETDLKNLEAGIAEFDGAKDRLGPLPLAVAVTKERAKGRLVVVGDSDFVNNQYLTLSGNKDFILNTVAWLAGDDFLIAIRPRERSATPLFLKETDQEFLFIVPVLGLPFASLVVGACVFFFRRRFA